MFSHNRIPNQRTESIMWPLLHVSGKCKIGLNVRETPLFPLLRLP